jgi:hypothetical protein
LIKKVWEADALRCPKCSREMRIVSLIYEEDVIERIHASRALARGGSRKRPSIRAWTTHTEPVMAFSAN